MPKLGIKEQEIVKISKNKGLSVLPDSVKSQVGENETLSLHILNILSVVSLKICLEIHKNINNLL